MSNSNLNNGKKKEFSDVALIELMQDRMQSMDNDDLARLFNDEFATEDEQVEYDESTDQFVITSGGCEAFAQLMASETTERVAYLSLDKSLDNGNFSYDVMVDDENVLGTFDAGTAVRDKAQMVGYLIAEAMTKLGFRVIECSQEWFAYLEEKSSSENDEPQGQTA